MEYVEWCKSLGCAVDPSVVTSLETDWTYVKASNEYSLLPLLKLVEEELSSKKKSDKQVSQTIETLRVKRAGQNSHLADANARVVAKLLGCCPNLKHLDLSAVGLSKFGAAEIIKAVQTSTTLETLNLANNPGISPALSDGAFATALRKNSSLTSLDLTNDQLGFSAVSSLRSAMKQSHCGCGKEFEILDDGNNVFEEILNALTHGVGTIFALVGSYVLMHHASAEGQSRRTYYSCLVYCSCLVILFLSSTALHAAFMNKTASTVLGLLDHAAIYFLIAGTYLPFCLISLEGHPLGDTLAIAEWVLALIGIIFCFVDERVNIPFKMPIELTLYLSMGWMMVVIWDDAVKHISDGAIDLLAMGGAAYTFGVLFFIMEKVHHPIGHAIWHVFVLIGAVCHYFAVLLFVVGIEQENVIGACIEHH